MSRTYLEQLAEMTTIVADTGDLNSIAEHKPRDATTNPSLIMAAAQIEDYADVVDAALISACSEMSDRDEIVSRSVDRLAVEFGKRILAIIDGRVSTEVDARLSYDQERTVAKARQLIEFYQQAGISRERVLIKIAATWEGIGAARLLEKEGTHCNLTLLFGLHQAVACADAGVTLISPFVGRILDWHQQNSGTRTYSGSEDPGVQSVMQIYDYFKKFGYQTEIMGASFRNLDQILELAGCDLLTISPAFLSDLSHKQGQIERKLDPDLSRARSIKRLNLDESVFRNMHARDRMSSDKLKEGIEGFSRATIDLEQLLEKRLATLEPTATTTASGKPRT